MVTRATVLLTINCMPMSVVQLFPSASCASAVPQYSSHLYVAENKNDDALSGLRRRRLGRQLSCPLTNITSYCWHFETSKRIFAEMDMPVNVPVDDPNADTEWYEFVLLHEMVGKLINTYLGTTFCESTE
jgi:hypothetical protein